MSRLAVLELHKDEFSFSAGHFTIFSATAREDLHGHNYYVGAKIEMLVGDNGLAFDYRVYKQKIQNLISPLDRKFLLPAFSQFLKIEKTDGMILAHYNTEKIPFLNRDVVILPVTNITLEELSYWLLRELTQNKNELTEHGIQTITLSVFNGPGQSGSSTYNLNAEKPLHQNKTNALSQCI